MYACGVCSNTRGNRNFFAREMVLGSREEFEYVECAGCGCIQIKEVPGDFSKYYGKNYYSFKARRTRRFFRDNAVRFFFRRQRARNYLGEKNLVGGLVERFFGTPEFFPMLKRAGAKVDSEILDIGSGSAARFLLKLQREGFTRIQGADPFVEVADAGKLYDTVILSHTFEHVEDPGGLLKDVCRILKPGGCAVVSTPVVPSIAWRRYGVDWSGFHAPQHLFLHSTKSVKLLVERAGLRLGEIEFTSVGAQFWVSDLMGRDIPLSEIKADPGMRDRYFSEEDIRGFDELAEEANGRGEGDTADYYLYRP